MSVPRSVELGLPPTWLDRFEAPTVYVAVAHGDGEGASFLFQHVVAEEVLEALRPFIGAVAS